MKTTTNRWPLNKSYFWQEIPFFRILIPLILGIVLYDAHWLKVSPGVLFAIIIVAAISFIFLSIIGKRGTALQYITFGLLQVFLIGFSIYWCLSLDDYSKLDWFGKTINSCNGYEVKVLETPNEKAKTIRARVQIIGGIQGDKVRKLCGQAFLAVYKNDSVATFSLGDTLLVPVKWTAIENPGNPFEYDYKTACRRNNLYFQQLAAPNELLLLGKGKPGDIGWLARFHNWSDHQLQRYLTDHSAYGLLQAMLLGDEQNFDPELRQAYSNTGIIHIVSISGSHVAVLFWVITTLLFWIKGPKGSWVKYGLGVLFVWIYVLMAGAPPSALRSAIMFSVFAIGTVANKEGNSINTLLAAAFILLVMQPMWLFAVGFQLSFGAVLSIILFFQPIYRLWPQKTWLPKLLWQAIAASFAAEILTAPLVIYYFHNFPVFFLVANLAALFVIGFCALIGGMLIVAFSWIAPLAKVFAAITTWMILKFNDFILLLQNYNPRSFTLLYLSPAMLIVVYGMIIFLAVFFLRKIKGAYFAGLIFACIFLVQMIAGKWQSLHQERLVVYNSSHENLVERTSGQEYQVLNGADSNAQSYAAKPGHIAWRAWHSTKENLPSDYFRLHNKKVLLLRSYNPGIDSSKFPVDVLVVLQSLKGLSVADLKQRFQPGIIIAGNDQKRYLVQRWKDSCKAQNVSFHSTVTDGAFVLE